MASKGIYDLLINLQANTAKLQTDLDRANSMLSGFGRKTTQLMQGIGQGIGQAIGQNLVANVKALSTALTDLAARGDRAGAILDNFRELGGSAEGIKAAQRAVLGTVDAFELMRAANEGLARGIPGLNQNFAQLAEFANRFADATGGETVPVLNELINALATGAPKALAAFGFQLEEGATKAQNQATALGQLEEVMGRLAPLGESVTQAHESFTAALSDAINQIGIGINENEKLAEVYNALAEEVRSVDWLQFGEDFAAMIAKIASEIPLLDYLAGRLKDLANITEAAAGNTTRSQIFQLQQYQTQLQSDLESAQRTRGNFTTGSERQAEIQRIQREMQATQATIDRLLQQGKQEAAFPQGGVGASQNLPNPRTQGMVFRNGQWGPPSEGGGGGRAGGRDDTQARLEREKKAQEELFKRQLEQEERLARERSDQAAKQMQAQYEAQQRMIEESTGQWADALNVVFAGLGFDPQVGQQMADLGGQIVAGMFSDLEGEQGGFFGLGQMIGQGFADVVAALFGGSGSGGDGSGGSWVDGLAGMFGASSSMTTDEAHAAGIQGPGMQNGSFGGGQSIDYAGYAQAGMALFNAWKSRDEIDKQNGDNRGTGAAAGGTVGAVVGSFFGMPQVGQAIGGALGGFIGRFFGRGPQNPDTQARHLFANWLEDRLEEVGGAVVWDGSNRNPRRMTNFIEGPSNRFNTPGWADEFNKRPNAGVFSGVGAALDEVLDIPEDIGEQLGAMLFDNMEGNVNNLRMLMKKLGLTFQDMEKALVEMGLRGEKTWLEIEVAMQGASEAFKDGLVEVGNYAGAMQMLLDSGARGFEAVQSVRNIAVEAKEAGIQNFEQLREHLLKTFDPAVVDAFFAGLKQRGVETLDELANLDDRTAGGVVADMQAAGVQFKEVGDQIEGTTKSVEQSIKEATGAIRELAASVKGVKYEPPPSDEGEDAAFATGGVVFGPTRALMGEAGPEAILPVTMKNGRMGVSLHGVSPGWGNGGSVIHIDARGAAAGVEHEIRRAIAGAEEQIVRRLNRSMNHQRGRSL